MLCLMVIAATMSLVSCSKDEPSITEGPSEVSLKTGSDDKVLTIEFFSGKTESEKSDIRKEYISSGILKSWVKCPESRDVEKWTVFCPSCSYRDSDIPVRTDPCEDDDEEEEEETKSSRAPEDGPCQVKRAVWGDLCPF